MFRRLSAFHQPLDKVGNISRGLAGPSVLILFQRLWIEHLDSHLHRSTSISHPCWESRTARVGPAFCQDEISRSGHDETGENAYNTHLVGAAPPRLRHLSDVTG